MYKMTYINNKMYFINSVSYIYIYIILRLLLIPAWALAIDPFSSFLPYRQIERKRLVQDPTSANMASGWGPGKRWGYPRRDNNKGNIIDI